MVLLSSQGVGAGRHPAGHEDAVTRSGLDWTLLRPGGFHSNTLHWAGMVRSARMVTAPFGDVALPTVDPLDIAEVAATVLRELGHAGRTYTLTGPEPVAERTLSIFGDPTPAEQHVSPGVQEILGRPPRSFAEWAVRDAKAFRPQG